MSSKDLSSIRVLIADDHEIVRQGLQKVLSETSDLKVVGEAENGNQVIDMVQKQEVDVLVMDFDMPEKNGLDALLDLKQICPKLPVIILSIFPEDHYGTRFLKAGASGYIQKASASDQLVQAIRTVAQGGKFISPKLTEKLVQEITKDTDKQPHETLTDREFQVFRYISGGKRVKDIADELHLSINTVSTYRSRILEKMSMKSNAEIIRYAIKNGLIQ